MGYGWGRNRGRPRASSLDKWVQECRAINAKLRSNAQSNQSLEPTEGAPGDENGECVPNKTDTEGTLT